MATTIDLFRNETEFDTFPAGSTIFTEGEDAEKMYVVLEGEIALHVKGRLVITLGPGEVFGEMALIDSAPRIATATAVSDAKVVPINEKRFKFLVQQTPNFALLMLRVLTERLRRMNGLL
jgi:CRP/FNR family cyclic AMP-dependent transcriptional regulator